MIDELKYGTSETQLSVARMIRAHLKYPISGGFAALDPCCGTGKALSELIYGSTGSGYGVEFNEVRLMDASRTLTKVARGYFDETKISNDHFSLLFFKPPVRTTTLFDGRTVATERAFLMAAKQHLKADGVLVFIIPAERLTSAMLETLEYRFTNLQIFRFPDREYREYKELVVLGSKKLFLSKSKKELDRLLDLVKDPDALVSVSEPPASVYSVPLSGEPAIFRGLLNHDEMMEEMRTSAIWGRSMGLLEDKTALVRELPPVPSKRGHIAILLASGAADGTYGKDINAHLIRGSVVRTQTNSVEEVYDEETGENRIIERTLVNPDVSITIRDYQGRVKTLVSTKEAK